MKLCFVSVNGPRETYFVDEPHTYTTYINIYNLIVTVTVESNIDCLRKGPPGYNSQVVMEFSL
jgi:hypothetical protein